MTHGEARAGAHPLVKHLNSRHPDTVLFLAQHAGGHVDATAAELVAVSAEVLELAFHCPAGSGTARLPLTAPGDSPPGVRQQVAGLLRTARAQAPDLPLTSLEREIAGRASRAHTPPTA